MSDHGCLLILCRICGEPVSFKSDTVVDEEGNAVHEPCYAKEVTTQDCPSPKLHSHGMNPRVTLLHPKPF